MQELAALPSDATPPEMALQIHRQVREQTRIDDPYQEDKTQATRQALALYPMLKARVATASDPLETAVRIAIAGNIIDLGVAESYDLEANLERVLEQELAINHLEPLRNALENTDSILYLADNAGETVFDRVLIETLDRHVTYAVKASPIINDALLEDAIAASINQVAEIIDNGSNAPGTMLNHCSREAQKLPEANKQADQAILKLVTKGDPARLITPCASCHGLDGQGGKNESPAIAGQTRSYFIRTMMLYHNDLRNSDNDHAMRAFAMPLTDQEIRQLADYYSGDRF